MIHFTGRLVLKKTVFSAWASTLNMGLINKGLYGMFVACGIWCLADVSSVSPSSEHDSFRLTGIPLVEYIWKGLQAV